MAISASLLTSDISTTIAGLYTTASIAPVGSSVIYVGVATYLDGTAPGVTVSGLGLTWSETMTRGWTTSAPTTMFLSLWRAIASASAPTPGTLSLTMTDRGDGPAAEGCAWAAVQVTGANTVGPTLQAVPNNGTGTSASITLSAAADSANRAMSWFATNLFAATTEDTSWTELADKTANVPNFSLECQWRSDAFDTSAGASWGASAKWGGIAIEIVAGASPTSLPIRRPRFHLIGR
jgi:cytochrome c2